MRNLIIMAFLLTGSINMAFSQCPPSQTRGIHVVQAKDNLYRISLAYGVSMGEICKWNDIELDGILPVCTPLRVRKPIAAPTAPPVKDVIPQAENIPDEFNPKSDPNAGKPIDYTHHGYQGKRHTVKYGETVAGLAELYGFTERKFRQLNALSPSQNVTPGSILLTTECSCAVLNTDFHTNQNPTTTQAGRIQKPDTRHNMNTSKSNHKPQVTAPAKNLSPRDNTPKGNYASPRAPYMKQVEYTMLEEINLLRSNPAGYIKYVEQYRTDKKRAGYAVPDATVNELINDLKNTTALSTLQTSECVYNAAKSHGLDVKRTGKAGHKGSDGSMPWDRVKRFCPDFQDGNENLVGGPAQVRESVIILLIDHGISSRGHRKTLLNPHWTHAACYKIGQVGQMSNAWIQKFGQSRANTSTHMYNSTSPTIHSKSNRPVIHNPNQFSTKGQQSSHQQSNTSYSSVYASFMKHEENKMTQEINLLRASPASYIKYIEEYRKSKKRAGYSLPDATINELISELRNMKPIPQLQPSQCVYNAATKHGQDIRRMGKTGHQGSDGTWPWDRVKRSCTNFKDGNENLVGGAATVREAIIILLIDNGVSNRSHRRSLLNPYWTHVACYRIGQVGLLSNCWVQKFGQL